MADSVVECPERPFRDTGRVPNGPFAALQGIAAKRGHASIGALFAPDHAGTGQAAEITAVFVRYLFHTFRLHKVYLEVPGFNWPQVESGAGRIFHVEGVLRDHDHYAGRYWDSYVCAIYPDGHQLPR